MDYDPSRGFPRVVPELNYTDVSAAIEWLTRVFGFTELLRFTHDDGTVGHADLELESGVVMLSAGDETQTPATAGTGAQSVQLVYVSDVDAHRARVQAEGAEPGDMRDQPWGLRQYRVADLEGHEWEFTQFVRSVTPQEWGATVPA